MTKLLVSVRDLNEARVALLAGADLIDLKEPGRGSLGRCDVSVWRDVCEYIDGRRPVSAALGELIHEPLPLDPLRSSKLDFVKIGLAGCDSCGDWESRWSVALGQLPAHVSSVAVGYADHENAAAPPPREVLGAAIRFGCRALLLDTFSKERGNLFDEMAADEVAEITREARNRGLLSVLAGSLGFGTIDKALELKPDYVALRGGVCQGDRRGRIDGRLVRKFSERVARRSSPPSGETSRENGRQPSAPLRSSAR